MLEQLMCIEAQGRSHGNSNTSVSQQIQLIQEANPSGNGRYILYRRELHVDVERGTDRVQTDLATRPRWPTSLTPCVDSSLTPLVYHIVISLATS